jgi:hypothetical protein
VRGFDLWRHLRTFARREALLSRSGASEACKEVPFGAPVGPSRCDVRCARYGASRIGTSGIADRVALLEQGRDRGRRCEHASDGSRLRVRPVAIAGARGLADLLVDPFDRLAG